MTDILDLVYTSQRFAISGGKVRDTHNLFVYLDGRKIAELHVVGDDVDGYEYGLFYDAEDEGKKVYFQDIRDGLEYFQEI